MDSLIHLTYLTLILGGGLILAAFGEFLSEQTGILNLGIEGLMSIGAVTSILMTLSGSSLWTALFVTCMIGLMCGVIFTTATVILKADQALCGLAMTMLGIGAANFIGKSSEGMVTANHLHDLPIPFLSSLPFLRPTLFSQNVMSYGIYCILPFLIHFLLFRTRYGLNARATGENPEAAHAAGIAVNKTRFIYGSLGSMLATLSGGYLILSTTHSWSEGFISGQGWIAISLVLLGRYRILHILIAGLCFGFITAFSFGGKIPGLHISPILMNIMLYLSIIILAVIPRCIPGLYGKMRQPPAGLAIPFFHSRHR